MSKSEVAVAFIYKFVTCFHYCILFFFYCFFMFDFSLGNYYFDTLSGLCLAAGIAVPLARFQRLSAGLLGLLVSVTPPTLRLIGHLLMRVSVRLHH